MNPSTSILAVVTVAFAILTGIALADVGYFGIFEPHFQSWGAGQVFADLVILAVLSCFWMSADAKKSGLPAWPFIVLTFAAGSFGILFYLLLRGRRAAAEGREVAAMA